MIRSLLILALFLPALSHADPFVCMTGVQNASHAGLELDPELNPELYFQEAALRCETMKSIGVGLQATALVLSITSWRLACTGVGAEVAVYLKGGALGVQALNLIVGRLPCEESPAVTQEQVRQLAERAVCDELAAIGIPCRMR